VSSDAGPRSAAAPDDPDQVDFTWLSTLFRKLSGRLYQAPPDAAAPAGTVAPPEPAPPETVPPEPGPPESAPPEEPGSATAQPAAEPEPVARPDRMTPAEPPGPRAAEQPEPTLGPWMRKALAAKEQARREWRYAIPLAMVLITAWICVHNRFGGVDWGDDFALYLRQAKALAFGNIGEVLQQTRFSVDNSGWSSFSPYSYPWGWPLILAPFLAVFGLDYGIFKSLEVLAFCVFLLAFFALVRHRAGWFAATIVTSLIAVSRAFNGATDTVLSDLPYLCFVGVSLWFMDRLRIKGTLLTDRRALIVLGLLLAFTRSIRREGLMMLVALDALHIAVLGGIAARDRTRQALRNVNWRNVALPYGTFAAAVVVLHLLLPGVLLPTVPGTGLANISPHVTFYRDVLAEHIGLKDPGTTMQLFHSAFAATLALRLFLLLAVIGVVGRLLYRFEQDAYLVAFLVASTFLMMVSPFQESRYFFTVTPFLAYFAYQAIPTLAALVTSRPGRLVRLAAVPSAVGMAGLVMLCWTDLDTAIEYHRVYHYTVNGPDLPESKQMFAAVKEKTRGDDVILFARARAMSLYTDRNAIQGSDLDLLLPRADWYVMEKDSTYSQTLLTDAEAANRRLTKTWENGKWVLWRVPPPTSP
jgi:hypothetical protein